MRFRTFREVSIALTERDRALRHQAKEYARRLEDLNHAHARAEASFSKFQPREASQAAMEMFAEYRESRLEEEGTYREGIAKAFAALQLQISANTERRVGGKEMRGSIVAGIGVVCTIVGALVAILSIGLFK